MTVKASGRSALILATGLWICFAGPSQAAVGADGTTADPASESAAGAPIALNKYVKHGSHHLKKYAHHKSGKVALKSSNSKKATATDTAADDGDNSSTIQSSEIPPSVANANAQLASTDSPSDTAKAMSERANTILQAAPDSPADTQPAVETQVVSADQLNDVDRSLHESNPPANPPATTLAMASADAPAAPVAAASNDNSTWDRTSLIGKIFIGFGALLTMASAARMFMA